tara:strand:+ start:3834 stop:5054 length:1221 start_codon:yes stop_codon:yes gene_type:complete
MILEQKIESEDIINKKSNIRQLVDILQIDIAGKNASDIDQNTRKKYETFVTGGIGQSPVTSSLFHTVFDQDHTLQTSNEMLDLTIGFYDGSSYVSTASTATDASGKKIFPNTTLMMREKINIYKQYAQFLLGDSSLSFKAPFESETATDTIDAALFINFKRLFVRDGLDKEQLSFKLHKNVEDGASSSNISTNVTSSGLDFSLYSDTGAKSSLRVTHHGGTVASIVDSSNNSVGLVFYEKGILVLDAEKVFNKDQQISGTINAVTGSTDNNYDSNAGTVTLATDAKLIPDLWVSGSIDNVLDHICHTRFGRANGSAFGLFNKTNINSTIYFCRIGPNKGNFSSNPTYTDANGKIRSIQEAGDDPFSYITTIGLYNSKQELIAVAKTSRPIEKNPEIDLTLSVRIDY